jgi:hypothetical protein
LTQFDRSLFCRVFFGFFGVEEEHHMTLRTLGTVRMFGQKYFGPKIAEALTEFCKNSIK